MTVFEFLSDFPYLPTVLVRGKHKEMYGRPSNSELRRWLIEGAVIINGVKPKPWDVITFPIKELIFFPSSPNRVTIFS